MKGQVSGLQQSTINFTHFWQQLARRPARWIELYRQRRQLASISDAMLQDLGLSRADILQETERHFWDDPLAK
ncbi:MULTISPECIES: DUF1127 domain-containing protein [unclassified Pseudomonas]|uniref:DUF1127 domain-containing protein n=1 Tax=unclassified Pseudomonas TaxID=196821 RepID=UPI0011AA2599|nr:MULTISPECIES: DUF1127 domain-containing protein [unclassified Pseudomonas]